MARWLVGVLTVIALIAVSVSAQEKGGKKTKQNLPVGVWVKEVGDARIQFTIQPKALTVLLQGPDEKVVANADIGFAKDGVLFGRIKKVTPEGNERGPKIGELFSFRYKQSGEKMTISELQTESATQDVRDAVEGEYTRTKKLEGKKKKKDKDA